MNKTLQKISDRVIDLLYPRRCPVCDRIVTPSDQLIHRGCKKSVELITGAVCAKCGKKVKADEEYCSDCRKVKHYFDKGFSAFKYRTISGSIYKFKYMGRQEYADYYASEIVRINGDRLKAYKPDAIIPVPMYKEKIRKRGYNQAQVLAKAVGKRLDIPVYDNLVIRNRDTVPMKKLDRMGRRKNLKKAFIIDRNDVKLKCIIILDDIYTTGSTVDEIARMFRNAGVEHIYVLTLAIGQTT